MVAWIYNPSFLKEVLSNLQYSIIYWLRSVGLMFKACLNYREPVDGQHGQLSKILSQNENNVKSLDIA